LEPRGNVHTVAEEVPSAHHYVADVNPDAEIDVAVGCDPEFVSAKAVCAFTAHCTASTALPNSARTLSPAVFAMRLPVVLDEPVEDRAPFGQPLERADFISAHEAAVALHIRCEDCNEASADFRRV
jgi:hypothetical protein